MRELPEKGWGRLGSSCLFCRSELDECIFFMCSISDEDLITKLKPRVLESLCCQKLFFSEQFQVSPY